MEALNAFGATLQVHAGTAAAMVSQQCSGALAVALAAGGTAQAKLLDIRGQLEPLMSERWLYMNRGAPPRARACTHAPRGPRTRLIRARPALRAAEDVRPAMLELDVIVLTMTFLTLCHAALHRRLPRFFGLLALSLAAEQASIRSAGTHCHAEALLMISKCSSLNSVLYMVPAAYCALLAAGRVGVHPLARPWVAGLLLVGAYLPYELQGPRQGLWTYPSAGTPFQLDAAAGGAMWTAHGGLSTTLEMRAEVVPALAERWYEMPVMTSMYVSAIGLGLGYGAMATNALVSTALSLRLWWPLRCVLLPGRRRTPPPRPRVAALGRRPDAARCPAAQACSRSPSPSACQSAPARSALGSSCRSATSLALACPNRPPSPPCCSSCSCRRARDRAEIAPRSRRDLRTHSEAEWFRTVGTGDPSPVALGHAHRPLGPAAHAHHAPGARLLPHLARVGQQRPRDDGGRWEAARAARPGEATHRAPLFVPRAPCARRGRAARTCPPQYLAVCVATALALATHARANIVEALLPS